MKNATQSRPPTLNSPSRAILAYFHQMHCQHYYRNFLFTSIFIISISSILSVLLARRLAFCTSPTQSLIHSHTPLHMIDRVHIRGQGTRNGLGMNSVVAVESQAVNVLDKYYVSDENPQGRFELLVVVSTGQKKPIYNIHSYEILDEVISLSI